MEGRAMCTNDSMMEVVRGTSGVVDRKAAVQGCHQNQIVDALPAGDRAGGVDEQVRIGHGFESGGGRGDQPEGEGDRPN